MNAKDIIPGSLVLDPNGRYVKVMTIRWLGHGRAKLMGNNRQTWFVNSNAEVKIR